MKDVRRHSRAMGKRICSLIHFRASSPTRSLSHFLIFSFSQFLILIACSSIDCPVENIVESRYALYKASGVRDTLHDTLYVFTLRRDGTDTTLLNRGVDISDFSLDISYTCPEDTLYFYRHNDADEWATDTVWVKKNDFPHFESVDCSATFFHEITAVRSTHHGIDSIIINQKDVDFDTTKEHLYLYLKAQY